MYGPGGGGVGVGLTERDRLMGVLVSCVLRVVFLVCV